MERALLGESFFFLPQLMTLNLFHYLYLLGVGEGMSVPQCICRDLNKPWKLVLSFHHMRFRDRTQAVKLGVKHFYPLSHLDGLDRDPEKP